MAIIDDFKARFPEFDTATVDTYLPAFVNVYSCYYGGNYDDGGCDQEIILNLLAHLLYSSYGYNGSTAGNASPIKGVASKSVGSVSVSYTAMAGNDASSYNVFFGSTKYGQAFLMLTRNNFGAVFV